MKKYDVIIIGGGAAGLLCGIEAGKRSRKTLIIEKANKIGKKILISGGGRCNFTNLGASPERYISENPHFAISALSRYTQHDFIELIEKHKIQYHEKKLGQLFCDDTARQVVGMLRRECEEHGVEIVTECNVDDVKKGGLFSLSTSTGKFQCNSLVIATGGISIPKMGATPFGYHIAEQFDLKVTERKPGLVPLTFHKEMLKNFDGLSGVSIDALVACGELSFRENILITHRGVSGPAMLQISSYWKNGNEITINFLPDINIETLIGEERKKNGKQGVKSLISRHLPKSFVERIFEVWLNNKPLAELSNSDIQEISSFLHCFPLQPAGSEGYRTAEVTVGGVSTDELSSKTFEANKVEGLYFIGEVVDVTGWLGGYNFQWAWSSGYCAGQYV